MISDDAGAAKIFKAREQASRQKPFEKPVQFRRNVWRFCKVEKMLEALKDGATLNPLNLKKVVFPAGYMVGVTNNEVTPENIRAELQRVAAAARSIKNDFVGVWYESSADVWFVDVSVFVADKAKALRMGATYQQQAIFDWAAMDCIYIEVPAAEVAKK